MAGVTNNRESNAGEEGSAERLILSTDGVDKLTGIRETLDEIRDDIGWWLKNNRQEQWGPIQPITSMPKDPTAPDWADRVNKFTAADLPDHRSHHPPDSRRASKACNEVASDIDEESQFCCDAPDLQWTGDPQFPGVACLNCGYTVADCGTVVVYPVPDAGENVDDPGPTHQQQKLFGDD